VLAYAAGSVGEAETEAETEVQGMTRAGTSSGAGPARTCEALLQLCGEILLRQPPGWRPSIVRAGEAVGLELLDLLLNPDHVLRKTEELTLRNTLVLGRRVRLDISLDQLSRQQEEGAMQLSALVSRRVGLDGPGGSRDRGGLDDAAAPEGSLGDVAVTGSERLWIPLDTVPRPLAVAVTVTGADGMPLPRPPQREVHQALEAALYHILRESLRVHPDFDADTASEQPVNLLMRHDETSRWLLQSALVAVCRLGPGTPRYDERMEVVRSRLTQPEPTDPTGEQLFAMLDGLAETEADASPRRTALRVLRDAVSYDVPFLELLSLVHGHYFVVAGLDRSVRDHSVQFELPESEALDDSVIKSPHQRSRRMLDLREHNYTVRALVPVPDNVRQFNLLVRTTPDANAYSYNEVSLIGALRYDDHPGQSALDALRTCADEIAACLASLDDDADGGPAAPGSDASSPVDAQAMKLKIGFVATRAVAALDRLEAIVVAQHHAADELEARWGRASSRTVKRSASKLRTVTTEARNQLRAARRELDELMSLLDGTGSVRSQVLSTTEALRSGVRAMEHRLLATQLVSNELPGQEVARIIIDRSTLPSASAPRPRILEVWSTVTDEARPYASSAVGPPLSLAVLVYLTGAMLFDTLAWPGHVGRLLPGTISTGAPDAVVAVLLLVPALAATQFTVPDRWSVAGLLRRPARLFVLAAIGVLGATAMVVATQVGGSEDAPGRPGLVLGTFRAALGFFMAWSLWAGVAAWLRSRYSWRPKGLRSLFGIETFVGPERKTRTTTRPARRYLTLLGRYVSYDNKAPDANFDLTLPTRSFPSHAGES
jgi:hypothetical protein